MTGTARARVVLTLWVCTLIAEPATASVTALPLAGAPKCPVFPKNNVWNKRVDKLPKKKNSDAIIESIGLDEGLHPDFGPESGMEDPLESPTRSSEASRRSRA
jgi:hypothetical protein